MVSPRTPSFDCGTLLSPGRVAQRESARFTRERSLVRSQPRPYSAGNLTISGRRCSPRCRRAPRPPCRSRRRMAPGLPATALDRRALGSGRPTHLDRERDTDTVDRAAEAGETLWVLPEVPKRHPATSSTPRLSQRHKPLRRGIDEHTEGRPSGLVDRELRKTKFIGVASQCFGVRSDADPRSHSHPPGCHWLLTRTREARECEASRDAPLHFRKEAPRQGRSRKR
jgi:hypothetical protein